MSRTWKAEDDVAEHGIPVTEGSGKGLALIAWVESGREDAELVARAPAMDDAIRLLLSRSFNAPAETIQALRASLRKERK